MMISTRTRYGTRALVELACAYPERAVSVKEIAESQKISPKYLEQILAPVKASGIIRSVRGMHGGYALAKPPDEVQVMQVFRVLEGCPILLECVETEGVCASEATCPTRDLWMDIKNAVEGILQKTTLQDLVHRKKQKAQKGVTYEI